MARNYRPADDAKPAGKLYPQDRHAPRYGHPHHDKGSAPRHDGDGDPPRRSTHIERLAPGDDPTDAINRLYSEGCHHPHKAPHDAPRERTRSTEPPQPGWDEYAATYRPAQNSPVSPAPDESAPQFKDDKVAGHDDASGWVRGTWPIPETNSAS
jgi:hypothetical protein